jgi:hypothetical protein
MQWQDTKRHAQMRTATLLQWKDTKLHAQMRTAAQATATATATATTTTTKQDVYPRSFASYCA